MIAEQLKRAVLQAAIQGKLTEQLPEDGDARDLLKDIQKEKALLIKEGKQKKEKPLPEITGDEIPFDIPETWVWVRLGEITHNHGQKKPLNVFTYIDIGSVDNNKNILKDNLAVISPKNAPSRARKIVAKDDIIYATVRPYLHNVCKIDKFIIPEPIVSTGFEVLASPIIQVNIFLFAFLLSPLFDSYANDNDNSKGVAYPAINNDKFYKAVVPLPPLAEQQRIAEKLDQVLPEIENLALDENKLDELEKAFPKKMKDAILQAAIQGKLTEQLSEDGDARDLLKDIQKEKARLVKEGKLRRDKPLPEITKDEIPFDIPVNWVWVRLGLIMSVQTGSKDANWGSQSGKYKFYTCAMDPIMSDTYSFDGKCIIMPGNGANVGQSWLFEGKFEAYQRTYVLQSNNYHSLLEYILAVLRSDWKSRYGGGVYGSAIPYIRLGELTDYLLPLPPFAEQQRIVEKLDQLLPLLDRLE